MWIYMAKQKIDIGKLQAELYKLCERRLNNLDKKGTIEAGLKESRAKIDKIKAAANSAIQSIDKDLKAVDGLMREKIDLMNKYRG